MRRRTMIAIGGAGAVGGGGTIIGTTLYGSSSLEVEQTGDGTTVRVDGESVNSLTAPISTTEGDDAMVGISIPPSASVQSVSTEVVWAIERPGIWSAVTVELVSVDDHQTGLDPGVATAFDSSWGRSPREAAGSSSAHRRYQFPSGTTAGHVHVQHTVYDEPSAAIDIHLEARLSARSFTGNRIALSVPVEMVYQPD